MIRDHVSDIACTGCGACVSACGVGALTFSVDSYGFATPVLTGDCIGCGACLKACPLLADWKAHTKTRAYAAYTNDDAVRQASSSGGIFSLLAYRVLAAGGAVYGAAYDESFAVHHVGVEEPTEPAQLRGAKYAQSFMDDTFAVIQKKLASGQPVLFSGTPCQVAGLRAFLGGDDEHLLLADTVCHSVPSPLAWQQYVTYRAKKDATGILPTAVTMRSKHTGWSSYHYSCRFTYPDGTVYSALGSDDLFMRLFTRGCISRPSCAECRFKGYDRVSDVTLGDFWGIWELCPDMDDDRGTSLLLVHTEKGKQYLQSIRERITLKEMSLEDASKFNPAILRSIVPDQNREQYLAKACSADYDGAAKALDKKPSLLTRLKRKLTS